MGEIKSFNLATPIAIELCQSWTMTCSEKLHILLLFFWEVKFTWCGWIYLNVLKNTLSVCYLFLWVCVMSPSADYRDMLITDLGRSFRNRVSGWEERLFGDNLFFAKWVGISNTSLYETEMFYNYCLWYKEQELYFLWDQFYGGKTISSGSMLLNVVRKNEQTRRMHLKQEGPLQLDGQKIPEDSCDWYRFSMPLKTSLQMRGLFIKQKRSIVFMFFCKGKAKQLNNHRTLLLYKALWTRFCNFSLW